MASQLKEQAKENDLMTPQELESMMGERASEKTFKPGAGGILAIISGYMNILTGLFMWVRSATGLLVIGSTGLGVALGIFAVALGILSVIGGSLAVARRAYPMALIGSIASMAPTFALPTGSLSLIFVGLSKNEFHTKRNK